MTSINYDIAQTKELCFYCRNLLQMRWQQFGMNLQKHTDCNFYPCSGCEKRLLRLKLRFLVDNVIDCKK